MAGGAPGQQAGPPRAADPPGPCPGEPGGQDPRGSEDLRGGEAPQDGEHPRGSEEPRDGEKPRAGEEQRGAGSPATPDPGPAGLAALRFDQQGLVPVVVQDRTAGEVLMLAYANREALARTLADGKAWFYSRSRQRLWRKGETSGHELAVHEVRIDCDGDAVLYVVEPSGPACHTGERSCFHRDVRGRWRKGSPVIPHTPAQETGPAGPPAPAPAAAGATAVPAPAPVRAPGDTGDTPDTAAGDRGTSGSEQPAAPAGHAPSHRPDRDAAEGDGLAFLSRLEAVIRSRWRERPAGSYTTALFAAGLPRILQKVGEEAVETVVAGGHQGPDRLVEETADLVYHLTVLLVAREVGWADVVAELRRRASAS
ncbi:hypothetical protein JCM13210_10450 [Thermaerobacter litoralis]